MNRLAITLLSHAFSKFDLVIQTILSYNFTTALHVLRPMYLDTSIRWVNVFRSLATSLEFTYSIRRTGATAATNLGRYISHNFSVHLLSCKPPTRYSSSLTAISYFMLDCPFLALTSSSREYLT